MGVDDEAAVDWFERITGFREGGWLETQRRLSVVDGRLHVDGRDSGYRIGRLEILSLSELRERAAAVSDRAGVLAARVMQADVRELHRLPASSDALFQVASQFNLLEMVGPDITPEQGVTRYADDHTQGPACAVAAGAGTIFRNYLLPFPDGFGQTAERQVDCLAGLGAALGNADDSLWTMRNGYAVATLGGLRRIDERLQALSASELDRLRQLLYVGVQWNVQVTDPGMTHSVTQVYCSALPVAYCRAPRHVWERFATLVLEAAYESTLLAGVLNIAASGNPLVYLTRLGGGAFGNETRWIHGAMSRALKICRGWGLDVRVVSYGPPEPDLLSVVNCP